MQNPGHVICSYIWIKYIIYIYIYMYTHIYMHTPLFLVMQIYRSLTFKWTAWTYVNTCRKTPLEIYFMYSGHKKIYCIFKTCSVLCSTKCCLFHSFIFFKPCAKIQITTLVIHRLILFIPTSSFLTRMKLAVMDTLYEVCKFYYL
jgi:hypothetical protein